jgi:hypothetical protein
MLLEPDVLTDCFNFSVDLSSSCSTWSKGRSRVVGDGVTRQACRCGQYTYRYAGRSLGETFESVLTIYFQELPEVPADPEHI